jgi:NAD(P)H dehydrogenase (quinone)
VSTGKILVTGATGFLGSATLRLLLEQVPAGRLAGLARDPARAAGLAAEGVEIRQGDYFDYESLEKALAGTERLMLVATHAFTDRNAQHFNAITAAARTGVKHVVFTSIQRNNDLDIRQIGVTDSDIFAEQALAASGMTYTILRHPIFLEQLGSYIGADAYEKGVRVPAGDGTVAPTLRRDLAAANVAVLAQDGHENKTYTLSGSEPASFRDLADALTEIHGSPVPYVPIGAGEYIDGYVKQGFPRDIAEFLHSWARSVNLGQFNENTRDLERLIGYRPTSYREFLAQHYPAIIPEQGDPQTS